MNRKLKLALAALLGFSAACSSVKNASTKSEPAQTESDTVQLAHPRIVVMYGVRVPGRGAAIPLNEKGERPDSTASALDAPAERSDARTESSAEE